MSTAVLEIAKHDGSVEQVRIDAGSTLVIGRGADADIRVDDPHVSSTHAVVTSRGGQVTIDDRKSANGTSVNGRRIDGGCVLHDGDILEFGSTRAVIRFGATAGDDGVPTPAAASPGGQDHLPFEQPIGHPPAMVAAPPDQPLLSPNATPRYVERVDAELEREKPADERSAGPDARASGRGGDVEGVVTRVRIPEANGNAVFSMELRTPAGDSVDVRRVFAFPFGVPYVAEGHQVVVRGRRRPAGQVVPTWIENRTTGVVWRSHRLLWSLVLSVVIAVILYMVLLGQRANAFPAATLGETGCSTSVSAPANRLDGRLGP
ncbi:MULTISPECIES: FHA domain-containing protein [Microbacterium]|uniref:FHA domain-containing protein n=1 Tax=Microbacterium TaxID=33882 RepID=UPI0013A55793|nr:MULTISPECIES: FHA domain-containing protein [Microbacterium]